MVLGMTVLCRGCGKHSAYVTGMVSGFEQLTCAHCGIHFARTPEIIPASLDDWSPYPTATKTRTRSSRRSSVLGPVRKPPRATRQQRNRRKITAGLEDVTQKSVQCTIDPEYVIIETGLESK